MELSEAFFTERLVGRHRASPHTIASYQDAFRLLVRFAQEHTGRPIHGLSVADLDADLVGAFIADLGGDRGASVRTRNARLTAIRSLSRFAARCHPEHAARLRGVLGIPLARAEKAIVTYLAEDEVSALLAAPDSRTRLGRRDHALLLLAVECGLRVSELTGLTCADVRLGARAHLRCHGAGRRERRSPLGREARVVLRRWLNERGGSDGEALFPGPKGRVLTHDAVRRLVDRHVATASAACPSLASRKVTPDTLRHTCAINLLRRGVDVRTLAKILGRKDVRTTYGDVLQP